jgi:hypothetical protein
MNDFTVAAPDLVHSSGDPGDDTARRFRYQWTYAAIICCMLLDEADDAAEVFCEHHEDVLIKHIDGSFSGLQIKTRASDQDTWKTSDEAIISSCTRFAKLEAKFPGRFREFRFLTNHPLYSARNGKDFRNVLKTIKTVAVVTDLPGPIAKFISAITRKADCTSEVAFAALSKTDAIDDLPKLPDIEMRLVTTLVEVWIRADGCSHAAVVRAARKLVEECYRASSLASQDILPAYLPAVTDPIGKELVERITGKRINRSRVLDILDHGLNQMATLDGDPKAFVKPGSGMNDLLLKKLDAGGFSAVSRNSAEDLRDKADYLGIVWINKYGHDQGLQRYGHVRSLVLNDAAIAFEIMKNKSHPFGIQMLSELRSRFQQRRLDGSQLYDCSNEHLEGFAYSLSSECKVQWSIDRPWEVE